MLIAIDIGNSSINIGFFNGSGFVVQKIETEPLLSPLQYSALIKAFITEKNIDKIPKGIIISSVVPSHTGALKEAFREFVPAEPLIVSCRIKTGIKFKIPNPEELGSDRIADAVAAYEIYRCPVAAVDSGTATTISVVGADSDFIGGAIIPGIKLMNESLAKGTSKLKAVPPSPPASALGIDTIECIRSGLFYGTAGAVERLLGEMEKESCLRFKVVLTGGCGELISRFLEREHDLRPHLTMEGLGIIYMRNIDA